MKTQGREHAVSYVFVFLLLCMFAVLGAVITLLCAQSYRTVAARTAQHNETRVLQSFIRHAVRAGDADGLITITQHNGGDVLCLADADGRYTTYIYVHDGALRELYADAFQPERGETLCPAAHMAAALDGQRLTVTLTGADGQPQELVMALRGKEDAP